MIAVAAVASIVLVLAAQAVAVSRLQARAGSSRPAHARPRGAADTATELRADGGWLVNMLRRRGWLRRSLSFASVAVTLVAVGMIGSPFYTNLYQNRLQGQLDRQLASPELRDAYLNRDVGVGDSLTRIQIPRIGVDVVVVEGTTASALRAGAGHYPSTPLPCEVGNVAIAGHRTTYGRPFHDLDQLEPGDRIILETPVGECTYELDFEPFIVAPTQVGVVANTPEEARLTLTTCHPKGSARQRLIVTAKMVSAETFDA